MGKKRKTKKVDTMHKVDRHILVFADKHIYITILGVKGFTLNKDQLMALIGKDDVLTVEFKENISENHEKIDAVMKSYSAFHPEGMVIYVMVLDNNELVINPAILYSPTLKVNFGK